MRGYLPLLTPWRIVGAGGDRRRGEQRARARAAVATGVRDRPAVGTAEIMWRAREKKMRDASGRQHRRRTWPRAAPARANQSRPHALRRQRPRPPPPPSRRLGSGQRSLAAIAAAALDPTSGPGSAHLIGSSHSPQPETVCSVGRAISGDLPDGETGSGPHEGDERERAHRAAHAGPRRRRRDRDADIAGPDETVRGGTAAAVRARRPRRGPNPDLLQAAAGALAVPLGGPAKRLETAAVRR